MAIVTQAVVRGVSVPLVAAATTGYLGATLWRRRRQRLGGRRAWLTSPAVALAFGLAARSAWASPTTRASRTPPCWWSTWPRRRWPCWCCGPGCIMCCCMSNATCGSGPRGCARTATGWCPRCRSARCAGWPSRPQRSTHCRWSGPGRRGRAAAGRGPAPAAGRGCTRPPGAVSRWPTVSRSRAIRHLGHRHILAVLIAGLGLLTAALVVLALSAPAATAQPCTSLSCFAPFGPVPVHPPHLYTAAAGLERALVPADAVFSEHPPATRPRPGTSSSCNSPTGLRPPWTASSRSSASRRPATAQQTWSAPCSKPTRPTPFPITCSPEPTVGYLPGYGEAFQTTPNSADRDPVGSRS